ncbi:MAG: hypothetical protein MRZ54_02230, partial [Clostridiales bacterium]|nr:hypothetical protein [Clostridiales bacterium]
AVPHKGRGFLPEKGVIQNAGTSSIKRCTRSDNLHPLLHPTGCIVPCIIVHRISHIIYQLLNQRLVDFFCPPDIDKTRIALRGSGHR